EWRRVVGTDLDAVFFWAQEAARRMLASGKTGAIVNIASVLGFGVAKGTAAYAVAKAGVVQLTKALGLELAFKGVRVNAIAPGWIVTDINRDYLASEQGAAIKRDIPVGRFGEEHVLPLEADPGNYDDHENIRLDVLRAMQAKAKAEGLWAPQAPKEYGGMALPVVGWAAMYEEANRSIFGPLAFNCAAPDDG